jgi:hypothetical protein
VLQIGAELRPPAGPTATVKLSASMDGKTAATARLEVGAKET